VCAAAFIVLLASCGAGNSAVLGVETLDTNTAKEQIKVLAKSVTVHRQYNSTPDIEGDYESDTVAELPDFENYVEEVVRGTAAVNVGILTATERAIPKDKVGTSKDDWINIAAEKFNNAGLTLSDGRSVSVSIYSITSGLAYDYIKLGLTLPQDVVAYNPSTTLWVDMLDSSGIETELIAESTAGNTVGICMEPSVAKDFESKYGEISIETLINAVTEDGFIVGMTDPFRSSTGLTTLQKILMTTDAVNPLSVDAQNKLEQFLGNVPSVAVTTAQLRNSLNLGVIKAAFMEYQSFAQSVQLRNYKFVPFDCHDGPVVLFGNGVNNAEYREVMNMYINYLQSNEMQLLADERYFNADTSFNRSTARMQGDELIEAQKLWKAKKDVITPTLFYFVLDTSGSMNDVSGGYSRLEVMREAVLNSINKIDSDNYIGMLSYNNDVKLELPIAKADALNKAVLAYIIKTAAADGGTATNDAICVAANEMYEFIESNNLNLKMSILLLSDGERTAGMDESRVLPSIYGLRLPINAVGYSISAIGENMLKKVVGVGGEGYEGVGSYTSASVEELSMKLMDLFNSQA
jgi:Ca-activated chloride channel family protein